jgi:hypothetical protein
MTNEKVSFSGVGHFGDHPKARCNRFTRTFFRLVGQNFSGKSLHKPLGLIAITSQVSPKYHN